MKDVFVRVLDFPTTIQGTVVEDENGDFNVYINSRIADAMQKKALVHELVHIERNDFEKESFKDAERFNRAI